MDLSSNLDSKWAMLSATRFVLAFIVLSGHIYCGVTGGADWTHFGLWWNQGSAVFGFLVLSGYSIAASLERSRSGFRRRRIVRLAPVYLLSLCLATAIAPIIGDLPIPQRLLASLLMLQGIVSLPPPTDGQLWTLAVEWWLYMAAPFLNRSSSVLVAFLLGISLSLNMLAKPGDASKLLFGESLLFLAWYWFVGFLYYRYRQSFVGYLIVLLPVAAAAFSGAFVGRAVWIGISGLLLSPFVPIPQRLHPALNWLGDLSYPIYCLHGPILALFAYAHLYCSLAIYATVFAISIVALHLVDRPMRNRLSRSLSNHRATKCSPSTGYRHPMETSTTAALDTANLCSHSR